MRYTVVFAAEYWRILDTVKLGPTLAYFHKTLPDAEKEANALASELNSEAK